MSDEFFNLHVIRNTENKSLKKSLGKCAAMKTEGRFGRSDIKDGLL